MPVTPLEKLRTLQVLSQEEARSLAQPEHADELLQLAADPQCGGEALLLLAHLEDERLVSLARRALEEKPEDYEAARALLWVGPAGRLALRDLGGTRKLAITTMLDGLNHPPMRPAVLDHLTWLVRQPGLPRGWGQLAAAMLMSEGWASAAADLEERAAILRIPDGSCDSWKQAGYPRRSSWGPCDPPLVSFLPAPLAELSARNREMSQADKERWRATEAETQAFVQALPTPERTRAAGRNEPCPCGSGKKYKRCCLDLDDARGRMNPWRAVRIQTVGFLVPPPLTQEAEQVLALWESGRPPRNLPDSPTLRWACALVSPEHKAFEIGLQLVEESPPSTELDYGCILSFTLLRAESLPGQTASLAIPAVVRRGDVHHLQALTELLARICPGAIAELVVALLEARAPAQSLLVVAFAAVDVPSQPWRASLEARLEEVEGESGETFQLVKSLPRCGPTPTPATLTVPGVSLPDDPDLYRDLARFNELLKYQINLLTPTQPSDNLTSDSVEPWARECALRERLVEEHGGELVLAHEALSETQLRLLESHPQGMYFMLTDEELLWLLPRDASPEFLAAVAGAAGQLAVEAELGAPEAQGRQGRLVIAQPDHRQAVGAVEMARVAIEERLSSRGLPLPELLLLPVHCGLDESGPPPGPLATLLAQASAGREPVPQPVRAESVSHEAEPAPGAVDPAREALRKVLRRLHRRSKIGEAHTSIDLLWRGVEGHLKGEVKDSVEEMLRQGLLRDKPTLVGQHVSLEPSHLPAIERFIEEGEVGGSLGRVLGS